VKTKSLERNERIEGGGTSNVDKRYTSDDDANKCKRVDGKLERRMNLRSVSGIGT
jgi:hypothetical protein